MKKKRKKTFKKLRLKCEEHDMTIEELGEQIGRSRSYMNQCFCVHSDWRLSDMYRILDLFDIPHDQLHEYFPKGGKAA